MFVVGGSSGGATVDEPQPSSQRSAVGGEQCLQLAGPRGRSGRGAARAAEGHVPAEVSESSSALYHTAHRTA